MSGEEILGLIWQGVNSPIGYMAAAGIVIYLLNRLYAEKPAWEKYEGTIISAVKFAEKEIPDGSENSGLARLDLALKYVLNVYEAVQGTRAGAAAEAQIKEGIQIVHDRLEAAGTLR